MCDRLIGGLTSAHLSLASGELDVHETASVLEPLHGTALTAQLSAFVSLNSRDDAVSQSRSWVDESSLSRAAYRIAGEI